MSVVIYRLLLRLYPREFRLRWEDELVETFAQQLADDWLEAWCSAAPELWLASWAGLAVPAVSLAGSAVLFFSLTWALGNSLLLLRLYHLLIAKLGG